MLLFDDSQSDSGWSSIFDIDKVHVPTTQTPISESQPQPSQDQHIRNPFHNPSFTYNTTTSSPHHSIFYHHSTPYSPPYHQNFFNSPNASQYLTQPIPYFPPPSQEVPVFTQQSTNSNPTNQTEQSKTKVEQWKTRIIKQYYSNSKPIDSIVGKSSPNDKIICEQDNLRFYIDVKEHFGLTLMKDNILTNSFNYKVTDYTTINSKNKKRDRLKLRLGGHDLLAKMEGFTDIYSFLGVLSRNNLLDRKRLQEEGISVMQETNTASNETPKKLSNKVFESERVEIDKIKGKQWEESQKRKREKAQQSGTKEPNKKKRKPTYTSTINETILRQVVVKNRQQVSNKTVDQLRNEGEVNDLSSSSILQHAQSSTDLLCSDFFNLKILTLKEDHKLLYHSIFPTLCCYALQHKKWIGWMKDKQWPLCEEDKKERKDLIVALNLDYAANSKLTTIYITIINSKCFGTGQSRAVCAPLAIWKGDESEIKHVAEHFKKEIEIIRKNGITIGSYHCSIDVFLTMDLKALGEVCPGVGKDNWCPFCNTKFPICTKHHKPRTSEELGCILGLPASNIIICVLHAKERLCENVLRITLSGMEHKEQFWTAITKVKGLEYINKVEDEEWNDIRIFLHGNTCNTLLENIHVMSPFFASPKTLQLWKVLKEIFHNIDYNKPNEDLQDCLLRFWVQYIKTTQAFPGKSWYAHILVKHIIPLKERVGHVKLFETQAFESSHIDELDTINFGSSKGGGHLHTYHDSLFSNTKDYSQMFSSNGVVLPNGMEFGIDENKDLLKKVFRIQQQTTERTVISLGLEGKLLAQVMLRKLRILLLTTLIPNTFLVPLPRVLTKKRRQALEENYAVKLNNDEIILQQLCEREGDTRLYVPHNCCDGTVVVPGDLREYQIASQKTNLPSDKTVGQHIDEEQQRTGGILKPVTNERRDVPAMTALTRKTRRKRK